MLPALKLMSSGTAMSAAVFLALVAALALGFAISNQTVRADGDEIVLDVRVGSAGSQLAAAGSACAEIEVGQIFPVDVRVENVDDLMAYELRVSYDGTILAMESVDFEHFLVSTPPNGQIFPSLFVSESADSYFLGAAETKGSADSGSGVLARLQMRAIGEGMSEISIRTDPTVYGPRLIDNRGKPIADDTGDWIFDGTVLSGTAAVNNHCPDTGGEDPADSSAEPGDGGSDPGTGGGPGTGAEDSTAEDSTAGSGNGPVDVVIGGGSQNGDPADAASAGDSGNGSDSESGDDNSANDGTDADGGSPPDKASNAADSAGGPSLGLLWYVLIALVVALAILATLGLVIKAVRAP